LQNNYFIERDTYTYGENLKADARKNKRGMWRNEDCAGESSRKR